MSTGAGYIVQGPKRVAAVLLAVMKLVLRQVKQRSDRTTDWLRRHLKSDRESITLQLSMQICFWPQTQPV
jgi:hypothetical protein